MGSWKVILTLFIMNDMQVVESNILVARQYLDCRAELAREQAKVKLLRRVVQEEVVKQSFNSALLMALGGLLQRAGVQAQIGDAVDLVDKMRFLESMVDRLKQALRDTE